MARKFKKALNIIKNKFVLKIIYYLTSHTYNLSDILIAQSKSFKKILKKEQKKKYFIFQILQKI